MAVIDIKNATIRLKDGTTPVTKDLTIKIGEGNLTYTETKNREYILDRGRIDSVRDGDEAPLELSFDVMWEEIVASNGQELKPEEALKKQAGAADWVSSDDDTCQPYAVDVELELDADCGQDKEREIITFTDFRYESLGHDLRAGTISASGSCNIEQPLVEHAIAAKWAAAFDADNMEWLQGADNALWPIGAAASFEFWFYAETVTGLQGLVTKWDDGTEEWAIYLQGNKLRFDVGAAAPAGLGVNYKESTVEFLAKKWYHIFVTYAAGTVVLYINNVVDAGVVVGAIPAVITDTATVVQLGAFVDADGAGDRGFFTGRLAELAVYDATIGAGVVASLYNTGLGKLYVDRTVAEKTDVTGAWDLGEQSGTRFAAAGAVNLTDNATVLYNDGIRKQVAP